VGWYHPKEGELVDERKSNLEGMEPNQQKTRTGAKKKRMLGFLGKASKKIQ